MFQLSTRSADLRNYGRDARRTLYPVTLGPTRTETLHGLGLFRIDRQEPGFDFAQSFHDIVADPPAGLPVSLRGKMAFLYFDGNGFSAARAVVDIGKFGEAVAEARAETLTELLSFFMSDGDDKALVYRRSTNIRRPGSKPRDKPANEQMNLMRLETLVAGGEDFSLVVPAWLAWDVAWRMLDWLDTAGQVASARLLDGRPLGYRAGMVICHHRTPARRATAFAEALCEDAKKVKEKFGEDPEPALSLHIVESHDVPEVPRLGGPDLVDVRRASFDPQDPPKLGENYGRAFRFTNADRVALNDDLAWLKAQFPRSQVYNLLEHDGDFDRAMHDMANRARKQADPEEVTRRLAPPAGWSQGAGSVQDPQRLRLIQIAELWDYFQPLVGAEA